MLEVRDGARRIVNHIGYPGNYGSVPKTRVGDGDPLDILAIGPAAERGTVIPVKVVGVFRCADESADDKVIAIAASSPLYSRVSTAAELDAIAPGAADILHTWFGNYKGAGGMTCSPLASEIVAAQLIAEAQAGFTAQPEAFVAVTY